MCDAEPRDTSCHIILDVGDIGRLWRTHARVFQHLTAFDAADDDPISVGPITEPKQIISKHS
ncbi:hypothetical protein X737_38045 [Mesorhizobium sp. L48C026A00]|nr:hypothetical protein X737_38045 [Mesorhizobium sp. L48C026A00]